VMWGEIKNIFTKEEELTGKDSVYVISRILSYSPFSFIQVKAINKYIGKIPDLYLLRVIRDTIPEMDPPWIQYPKKEKVDISSDNARLIKEICNHFNCSELHAEQIYTILQKEGVNVMSSFGVNVF